MVNGDPMHRYPGSPATGPGTSSLVGAPLSRPPVARLVVLLTYRVGRFVARLPGLAFGLALAVRPAGSLEAPRARVGPEDPFCGAVRKDLRVPLRVEGAARTMRGVPPPPL